MTLISVMCETSISAPQHRRELAVEEVPVGVLEQAAGEADEAAQRGADRQHHQRADHAAGRLVDVVLDLVGRARLAGEDQEVEPRHVEGGPQRRDAEQRTPAAGPTQAKSFP